LIEGDVIRIAKKDASSVETHAEVTHVYETTVGVLLGQEESVSHRSQLQNSAGREITDADKVTVHEIHEVLLPFEGSHLTYMEHSFGW
jgi:hypothetical protein